MESKYYVYGLFLPGERSPFYIGKGCGNRLNAHLSGKDTTNKEKVQFILNARNCGIEPEARILIQNLEEDFAYGIESNLIRLCKHKNIYLTNKTGIKTPPSRKNCYMSVESRKKISDALKGRRGRICSQETKTKLSNLNKGRIGPNKAIIEDINLLKQLYLDSNYTKKQLCSYFGVGEGSISRILQENNIKKDKSCFARYSKMRNCIKNAATAAGSKL